MLKVLTDPVPGLTIFEISKRRAEIQAIKAPKHKLTEEDIRVRAYLIWERTGKSSDECWKAAKRELGAK